MSAFTDVLLRSIDKGLGILGDTVRPCIYFHLERSYKLRRHDLAIKPEAFADALKAMFGAEPNILLKQIVKELYLSVGLEPTEHQNWKFNDYVAEARRIFKEQELQRKQ